MGVYIPSMEMPNACCHCPCSDSAGCAVTGRAMTTEEMAGQLGDIDDCPLHPLPEKHGHWYKPTGMMPPEFAGRHRCSECEEFAMHDWKRHREVLTPFCPNCGADMRGENDE